MAKTISGKTVDDGPEYELRLTIRKIDKWMRNDDPWPPSDLIEIFQSARWHLWRLEELQK